MGIEAWVRRVPPAAESPAIAPEPVVEATPGPEPEPAAATAAADNDAVATLGWEALRERVLGCTACALHTSRTQAVFGVGNPEADWLIVGEAPGAEEDRRGEPFVGRAGQLLDAILRAAGQDRTSAYIANILKCRPPNNRDPEPEEIGCCQDYLARQIALIRPRLILAVGRIAAQHLLATDQPIGRLRGRVHRWGEAGIPLVVTYHPAYLLRSPGEKRKVWEDLQLAMQSIREPAEAARQ
ncbi:uracil-DNA glycosylase [Thiohalobacter thiocyanaticus]|uniref:Type-4 uracil-DNA glycosylase n=2 Tax=Thiohalobacter thiocyanaticus TaxID=585455 RepID=A0A1Z4VTK5_9GAMM|nr:uracil-DNA glycosylase [Thiohalobacter thiocyanaticus]